MGHQSIKTTAEATVAASEIEDYRSHQLHSNTTRMSTQRWSSRVRQLVEGVVKAFSQVVQVPASSGSVDMRDFYFENLANSAENLHNLDKADNRRVRHFSKPFPQYSSRKMR